MREKITIIGATFVGTSVVAISFTLSFLRTAWPTYRFDIFGWWSVISTILGIAFAGLSLWQYFEARNQKGRTNAQVKIWMQDAKGIATALRQVQSLKHSRTTDVCNAISMIEASANAMYQSLYEERVVKEEDYQESEKRKTEITNQQEMKSLKKRASSIGSNPVSAPEE